MPQPVASPESYTTLQNTQNTRRGQSLSFPWTWCVDPGLPHPYQFPHGPYCEGSVHLWCWSSPEIQVFLDATQAMTPQPVVSPGSCTTLQSTQNTRSAAGKRCKTFWGTVTLKRLNGEFKTSWPFSEPLSLAPLPGWGREKIFLLILSLSGNRSRAQRQDLVLSMDSRASWLLGQKFGFWDNWQQCMRIDDDTWHIFSKWTSPPLH